MIVEIGAMSTRDKVHTIYKPMIHVMDMAVDIQVHTILMHYRDEIGLETVSFG